MVGCSGGDPTGCDTRLPLHPKRRLVSGWGGQQWRETTSEPQTRPGPPGSSAPALPGHLCRWDSGSAAPPAWSQARLVQGLWAWVDSAQCPAPSVWPAFWTVPGQAQGTDLPAKEDMTLQSAGFMAPVAPDGISCTCSSSLTSNITSYK